MIYIDANIFIYAYFKPKKGKDLSDKLKWCKEEAKKIVQKINDEESTYCISLIQISEVVNLLKNVMSWKDLQAFIFNPKDADRILTFLEYIGKEDNLMGIRKWLKRQGFNKSNRENIKL